MGMFSRIRTRIRLLTDTEAQIARIAVDYLRGEFSPQVDRRVRELFSVQTHRPLSRVSLQVHNLLDDIAQDQEWKIEHRRTIHNAFDCLRGAYTCEDDNQNLRAQYAPGTEKHCLSYSVYALIESNTKWYKESGSQREHQGLKSLIGMGDKL